jgi:hypothetical protein
MGLCSSAQGDQKFGLLAPKDLRNPLRDADDSRDARTAIFGEDL